MSPPTLKYLTSNFRFRICFEFRFSNFEFGTTVFLLTLTLLSSAPPLRADNKLSGAIIGTAGSCNNSGNTKEKAMDGNLSTFFDGPDPATDQWVGVQFGPCISTTISHA